MAQSPTNMKSFFKWSPLAPPSSYSRSTASFASLAGFASALIACAIVITGLDEGPWLYLPLVSSVFLFGLPHGAIDHLVMIGLAQRKMNLINLTIACLLYLSLVILMLLLWWTSPLFGLILFLGITVYHWGKADLVFESLTQVEKAQEIPRLLRLSHLLLRGFLPIGTPFLAFPEATEAFLLSCTSSFGYVFVLHPGLRVALFVFLGALLMGEAFYLRSIGPNWKQRTIEDIGLLIYFSLVPPVLAIGLYFCLWHGFRHVLRLVQYGSGPTNTGSLIENLGRFYTQAIPFTLASLVIVLATVLLLPEATRVDQLIGIYLVVISSLTLPHLCVVEWMDTRERIS